MAAFSDPGTRRASATPSPVTAWTTEPCQCNPLLLVTYTYSYAPARHPLDDGSARSSVYIVEEIEGIQSLHRSATQASLSTLSVCCANTAFQC